jgi:transcriptional regulator with XRE-family HTH domain
MAMTDAWVPVDTFAVRLRLIRFELGASVDEICSACQVKPATWSKWERGAEPRRMGAVVMQIAEATGADRDWLMWGGPLAPSTKWYLSSRAAVAAA